MNHNETYIWRETLINTPGPDAKLQARLFKCSAIVMTYPVLK